MDVEELDVILRVIPDVARRAIAKGVQRGDLVVDLEILGLSPRVINALAGAPCHITTLGQLLSQSRDDLCRIDQLGEGSVEHILDCLSRYHELHQARKTRERLIRARARSMRQTSLRAGQLRTERH